MAKSPQNTIHLYSCDWKAELSRKERKEILEIEERDDLVFEELDVYSADEKLYTVAPKEFL